MYDQIDPILIFCVQHVPVCTIYSIVRVYVLSVTPMSGRLDPPSCPENNFLKNLSRQLQPPTLQLSNRTFYCDVGTSLQRWTASCWRQRESKLCLRSRWW